MGCQSVLFSPVIFAWLSLLLKFDRILYKALRIVIGSFRFTPVHSLLEESGQLPFRLRKILTRSIFLNKLDHKSIHAIKNSINLTVSYVSEDFNKHAIVHCVTFLFASLPCSYKNLFVVSLSLSNFPTI